jgi:ubiquinone/menaquinone biosynthesis C-methylase UbiE
MPSSKKPQSSPSTVADFWDQQAEEHGHSDLATNPDQHYRQLEIASILRVIKQMPHDTVLDVGCGNGFTTIKMAQEFQEAEIMGIDFSPAMIEQAGTAAGHKYPNIDFYEGDVLSLSRNKHLTSRHYDVVLSTRCLINLANWEEQKVAILEMRKMLKPDGRLILVENFKEGLANLNHIRASLGLHPIKERWHNFYVPQNEYKRFIDQGSAIFTTEYAENIGNFYYLASRVIYAKMCMDKGVEPDYGNEINKIASQLPTLGEHYACSPNFLIVLRNANGQQGTPSRSLS